MKVEEPVLKDQYVNAILWEGNANEYYTQDKPILSDPFYDIVTKENKEKLIPDAKKAYTLYQFSLYPNESKEFNLILFMDEDTPVSSDEDVTNNAHWKSKVTINGQSSIETTGMLRKINVIANVIQECIESGGNSEICTEYTYDTEGMWGYREQIKEITFENELNSEVHTEEGVLKFDESALKDHSVMSYLVPNDEYVEGYEGTIEGMDYLNTSQVTDMVAMFYYMTSLTHLDLSSFDIRKVGSVATEYGWNGSFERMFSRDTLLTDITYGDNFVRMNDASVNNMFGEGSSAPKPPEESAKAGSFLFFIKFYKAL